METRKIFFTVFFCFFVGIFVGGAEAKEPVLITRLNVAPLLGEIRSEYDLREKIKREHKKIVDFVLYDLSKTGIKLTLAEAKEFVGEMESGSGKWEKISIPDGTVFLSMGWKSRKTGKVMRTEQPKLALGRSIEGYSIKIDIPGKEVKVEYVVLQPCGNLCLREVRKISPLKAELVPPPPPQAELTPPPPQAELVPPPPSASVPTPQSPPTEYYSPPPPPPPVLHSYSPWYFYTPYTSCCGSSSSYSLTIYDSHRPHYYRPHYHRPHYHYHRPTPPSPPAVKPPTVSTKPPGVTTRTR